MKNRTLATDIARRFGIGRFFEELTPEIVGGVRSKKEFGIDVEHDNWDAAVEVKAAGSSEQPALYVGQLEKHLEQRGFPYTHCCYAVWSYHNTRQNRIGTTSAKTALQLAAELAWRTRALYVLDVRILEAALLHRGTASIWRDEDYRAARVQVNTTWFRKLAASPHKTLLALGLRPRSFYIQQAQVRWQFLGFSLEFAYTAVLPRSAAGFVWPVHRRQKPQLAVAASA